MDDAILAPPHVGVAPSGALCQAGCAFSVYHILSVPGPRMVPGRTLLPALVEESKLDCCEQEGHRREDKTQEGWLTGRESQVEKLPLKG